MSTLSLEDPSGRHLMLWAICWAPAVLQHFFPGGSGLWAQGETCGCLPAQLPTSRELMQRFWSDSLLLDNHELENSQLHKNTGAECLCTVPTWRPAAADSTTFPAPKINPPWETPSHTSSSSIETQSPPAACCAQPETPISPPGQGLRQQGCSMGLQELPVSVMGCAASAFL